MEFVKFPFICFLNIYWATIVSPALHYVLVKADWAKIDPDSMLTELIVLWRQPDINQTHTLMQIELLLLLVLLKGKHIIKKIYVARMAGNGKMRREVKKHSKQRKYQAWKCSKERQQVTFLELKEDQWDWSAWKQEHGTRYGQRGRCVAGCVGSFKAFENFCPYFISSGKYDEF